MSIPKSSPMGASYIQCKALKGKRFYAASLTKPAEKVQLLSIANGESQAPLGIGASYASSSDGKDYLLWISGSTLFAQQFDAHKVQLIGAPRSLADRVAMTRAGGNVLLYSSFIPLRQFKWLDRTGTGAGLLGEPSSYVFIRISPDGRQVATIRTGTNNPDIWLVETERGVASRLTSGRGIHISPVWSPDGRTILFSGSTPFNIFRIPLDRAAVEERITESPNRQTVSDWSHDGHFIIYQEAAADTGYDLWVLAVTPEGRPAAGATPRPYIGAPFDQTQARFSPDDRWVAYQSDESGRLEVYVQAFPEPRKKFQISTASGMFPQWKSDGRELFYLSTDGKLMSVRLNLGADSQEVSVPHELFPLVSNFAGIDPYVAAPDGQRFLTTVPESGPEPLNVIVNWPSLLKKEATPQ